MTDGGRHEAHVILLTGLILALALSGSAADRGAGAAADEGPDWIPFDDPKVVELIEKIDAAGAHGTPDLELQKDDNYARTSVDVEPFRGVKPCKENFLLQMEYTGAGRAIPEPEDLETVKIGFIGPIMATVSVATGGKSHEEALGRADAAGRRASPSSRRTSGAAT